MRLNTERLAAIAQEMLGADHTVTVALLPSEYMHLGDCGEPKKGQVRIRLSEKLFADRTGDDLHMVFWHEVAHAMLDHNDRLATAKATSKRLLSEIDELDPPADVEAYRERVRRLTDNLRSESAAVEDECWAKAIPLIRSAEYALYDAGVTFWDLAVIED